MQIYEMSKGCLSPSGMVDKALSLTSLQRAILFSATAAAADKQEA